MALASPNSPFVWGAGGSMKTPEQVAREREIAAALMQGGVDYSPVDHWMQGLARAAQAGVGALKGRWADEAENAGREGFQSRWGDVFGGSQQVASVDPVASALTATDAVNSLASVPSGDRAGYIRSGLIQRGLPEHVADAFLMNFQDESGLNPDINEAQPLVPGSRGGYGLYQLTGPRRRAYEAYAAERGVPVSDIDAQLDFMMSELQGPEARAAQAILSAPDTGSAAAAIVNQFLRPAEEHRASRAARYTGGAPVQVAQAAPQYDMAQLLGLASDPWANDTQRSIVQSLLGQRIQQQDPMYQLQRQKAELELEAMRNPTVDPWGNVKVINDQVVGMGETGPQVIGDFRTQDQYKQLTPDEVQARGLDPSKVWQVGPDNKLSEAGGSLVTVNTGDTQTPGWKKIDEGFAPMYFDWQAGGWADTGKQIDQLDEALSILESGQAVTGPVQGALNRIGLGAIFNQDGTIAKENVEEVVQRSLREILGAQFTEREGERLIARAFNDQLPPSENAKRVRRLLQTIQGMANSKQAMVDYFSQNGTLFGYEGKQPTVSEIRALDFSDPSAVQQPNQSTVDPSDIDALLELYR